MFCAAGLVYRALGFPPQFFTVLFAVPRIVGYLSHWKESLVDPDTKIMRPQQDYRVRCLPAHGGSLCKPEGACGTMGPHTLPRCKRICLVQGVWLRDYTPVDDRKAGDGEFEGEDMGVVKPSNAYQRRIAGTNWT